MAKADLVDAIIEQVGFGRRDAARIMDDVFGTLKAIAQELVEKVRGSVTIDWTQKESVRAKLRVLVKRTLKKYGYPPDKQEKATQTVLAQAELLG